MEQTAIVLLNDAFRRLQTTKKEFVICDFDSTNHFVCIYAQVVFSKHRIETLAHKEKPWQLKIYKL